MIWNQAEIHREAVARRRAVFVRYNSSEAVTYKAIAEYMGFSKSRAAQLVLLGAFSFAQPAAADEPLHADAVAFVLKRTAGWRRHTVGAKINTLLDYCRGYEPLS